MFKRRIFKYYSTKGMLSLSIRENENYMMFTEYRVDEIKFMNSFTDYLKIGKDYFDNLDDVFEVDN